MITAALIAELRADGVDVADDASQDAILAALQQRITRLVISAPAIFDRDRYERLMRTWESLRIEEGEGP